ncbi:CatB-related O-acetyltransferase [Clostridium sp. YIM B02506]|uniref:CatB-related O-acetyltransferase n=1 Tax=Clostridium sp. YIM B02506 TaxID=2910680 RepID=UPI0023B0124C|nr:CatB-related O-acetyltransferase [Clostridium sp. YIM B02506]
MGIIIKSSDFKDGMRKFIANNNKFKDFPIVVMGNRSYIMGMEVESPINNEFNSIVIGNYSSISHNIKCIIDENHDYLAVSTYPWQAVLGYNMDWNLNIKGQIIIGNDVWIAQDVTILSGVTIGDGAVIGAKAVVAKDVPPYSIVVGNPARVVKYRFSEEQIKKLLKIKWWNWSAEYIHANKDWFNADIDSFIEAFYNREWDSENQIEELIFDAKKNKILFYPDFYDNYPVWKRVLEEYLNKFSGDDNVSLLLRIEENDDFDKHVFEISEMMENKINAPDVLIINDRLSNEEGLFYKADYYITTRNINTVNHINLSNEYNVKVLYGVDKPIFRDVVLKED